ncbi:hypothetical protein H257_09213 [Aphanomyces astaci]|uniref:Uncharacterized protein n=1 Tax=Aphanomyces astaci TaxID=112090 RepID=W4GAN8_APHAT|nr:hypothetical protein H257_09213 [Aphanomyces astaci]ETV76752.1 hypothetical protein H257_09213 [Aphanomyces astaci]|eukprot:XP_009833664.1 hypothetical protein H257_09213 [Aphanomyces astaci]
MATDVAMEFDMDESEILFGSNGGDSASNSDDDDDMDTATTLRHHHMQPRPEDMGSSPTRQTQKLPRVESWAVDGRSTAMMKKHPQWERQSHSMPAPSCGFLVDNRRRRNKQQHFDADSPPLDHPESILIPSSASSQQSSHVHGAAIPIRLSAPLHWRRKCFEDADDTHFVPPHQLVERDCFSLGMGHYFRHKPGNI